jgi:hypothetical protein
MAKSLANYSQKVRIQAGIMMYGFRCESERLYMKTLIARLTAHGSRLTAQMIQKSLKKIY